MELPTTLQGLLSTFPDFGCKSLGDYQMLKGIIMGTALSFALAGASLGQDMTTNQGQSGASMVNTPNAGMMAPDPSAKLTTPQYIMAASQSDEFEMQEGKLAEQSAKSVSLRKFGAKMVKDHAKTTNTLHDAIISAGMQVPPPPPLRPDQMQMIAQLQQMSGADFDRAYLTQQMQSHQEALMVQSNYARTGDVPSVRGAASKTVPIVQDHIAMLQQMQGAMSQ